MVDFLQQLDIYAQIATSRKIKLLMKKDSILYTHPEIVKDWILRIIKISARQIL